MKYPIVSVAASAALVCAACADSPIDAAKFQAVDRAARSVQLELTTSSDSGSPRIAQLIERFQAEVAALDGRASGQREARVVSAYAAAGESYRYLLRFHRLEREAVGGKVLLTGANRPIASRYELPTESRGGGRWVDRTTAMRTFAERAATELDHANQLLAAH
jgi:hypothetical protein